VPENDMLVRMRSASSELSREGAYLAAVCLNLSACG